MFSIDPIAWLLVLAGLASLIPYTGREARWSTWRELIAAGLCGYLALYLSNVYVVDAYIEGGMLVASDYTRYCQDVGALRAETIDRYVAINSVLPGLLPGLLARRAGVLDALLYTSMIATFAAAAGLYLWGRALGGRLAGALSALFFAAVAPLTVMVRSPTFYPEMTAVFIGTMACTALALRYRHPLALLLAGVGVALSLLVDLRGLLWAIPVLGLSLLACLPRERRSLPRGAGASLLRLLLLTAPVLASYPLGERAYLPDTTPLERQTEISFDDHARLLGLPEGSTLQTPRHRMDDGFVWGRSDLSGIVRAVSTVSRQQRALLAAMGEPQRTKTELLRAQLVYPWVLLALSCLAVFVVIKHRNHPHLVAFVGTSAVPLLMLLQSSRYLVYDRYIQIPSTVLPVLFGAGTAALALRYSPIGGAGPGRLRWRQWARPAFVVGACALLVTGRIDSHLSPAAAWRVPLVADVSIPRIYKIAVYDGVTHSDNDAMCAEYIRYDLQTLGLPPSSQVYPLWSALE